MVLGYTQDVDHGQYSSGSLSLSQDLLKFVLTIAVTITISEENDLQIREIIHLLQLFLDVVEAIVEVCSSSWLLLIHLLQV